MDIKKTTHAYTLVEVLVYAAIIVVVLIFVVTAVVQLTKPLLKLQNTRHVNEAGEYTMDRMVRELRRGSQITAIQNNQSITFKVRRTFGEQVKHDNAVAHWDFEEVSGTVLVDRIGSIFGTIISNPNKGTKAIVGNGYQFDGSDDYIALSDNIFNTITTGAIEAVFKVDVTAPTGLAAFFAGSESASKMVAGEVSISGNTYPIQLYRPSVVSTNPTLYDLGDFHHVVLQYDINKPSLKSEIYVDGTLVKAVDAAGGPNWFSGMSNTKYSIAGNNYGSGPVKFFDGIIDEIAVYNAPKSEGIWKSHYDAAWGVDNVANDKDVILQYNAATQQLQLTDDGAASTISNTKVSISNFVLEPIILNGNRVGVRIGFTATAGAGDTAVSQQFQTSVMMRNPNYE